MRPESWRYSAACIGMALDVFFPASEDACDEAKAVCATCPVRRPCLGDAMRNGLEGIWGGTTERERRVMRRERKKAS